MATRLSLPRTQIPFGGWLRNADATWRRAADRPAMTRHDRLRLLWRMLWSPYWFGSDVAAPQLPARDAAVQAGGLAGEQVVRMTTQIARRIWLQRALTIIARASWLGLLVGCAWLIVELAGGPDLNVDALIVVGVALVVPGVILAILSRPTRRQVARMLDRSFALHERVSTAIENLGQAVPRDGERASVVYLQMADAANVVTELRRHAAFRVRPPVRELVLAVAVGLLLASLYFLRGVGGVIPDAGSAAVPRFVPAVERFEQQAEAAAQAAAEVDPATVPTVAEVEQTAQRSNEARQGLDQLGQALDDHAVTRAAAEAIERGDYEAAANELRDLAERTGDLTPAAREGLAQDLETAASQMPAGSQDLADATNQAAEGLRQGDTSAQDGVRELGNEVERTGDQVVSQQELNQQMEQAQATHGDSPRASGSDAALQDPSDQQGEQSGQSGQEGQPGDPTSQEGQQVQPGEGGDAQPGQGEQQSGEQGASAQEPAEGQPTGEQAPGSGQGQQGGNPEEAGAQAAAQEGAAGQPGADQSGATGAEEAQAHEGAGAGSGSGEPSTDDPAGAGQQETGEGGEGAPAEENVSTQQPATGEGEDATLEPSSSLQLNEGPGSGVQTSENGGNSSIGSGAGVSGGSGTTVQGNVEEAGPDSNSVPPAYRSIVEDYFSDPGGDS